MHTYRCSSAGSFRRQLRLHALFDAGKGGLRRGEKGISRRQLLRAFYGESNDPQQAQIVELCCHIDDMTAEALAFAGEQLLAQGALDVSASPLTMKKGRAGVNYTVLCKPQDETHIANAILRETTTNGVRPPGAPSIFSAPPSGRRTPAMAPSASSVQTAGIFTTKSRNMTM